MQVRKAVITAAGPAQRALPLQTLVDRDGQTRSCLEIIVAEAMAAGIDQVAVIVAPGDSSRYASAAADLARRLVFIEQPEPRGYGHALSLARSFVAGEPFLHMISDHLYLSGGPLRCAQQLIEVARTHQCAVSAVQATRETMLPLYGAVGGKRVPGAQRLYEVDQVIEKPTPTEAEQSLIIPGLRAGYYLCFLGMHVLTSTVMDLLHTLLAEAPQSQRLTLSDALQRLAQRERYLATEIQGQRYNVGVKYGLLQAQLALALDGDDRDNVLAMMVELLATRPRRA